MSQACLHPLEHLDVTSLRAGGILVGTCLLCGQPIHRGYVMFHEDDEQVVDSLYRMLEGKDQPTKLPRIKLIKSDEDVGDADV